MSFASFLTQLVPTTFRRTGWGKFIGALGAQLDGSVDGDYAGRGSSPLDYGTVQRAKYAVKARFPDYAPPDALERLGIERKMPRGPGESDTSYAARLKAAWTTWPFAGTAFGLLTALSAGGYPSAEVRIQNRDRYYLDANGALVVEQRAAGEWRSDNNAAFWSRFAVLLKPPYPFAFGISVLTAGGGATVSPTITGTPTSNNSITLTVTTGSGPNPAQVSYSVTGDAPQSGTINPVLGNSYVIGTTGVSVSFPNSGYNAGWYWTFTATAAPADGSSEQKRVAQLVRQWKSAHATCTGVFVIPSGRTWGSYPTGSTWGAQGRATWGSDLATVTSWSP